MKQFTKILCLVFALVLVLGCMTGCASKVKPESVTDKAAVKEYNKIKNDLDKLFYSPDAKHPVASNVTALIGELPDSDELQNSPYYNENQEMSISATIDKLIVENEDYLKQLGGKVAVNGSVLTGKGTANYDLGATISGLTVDLDMALDSEGLSITSPFIFTQPVYLDIEALSAMADAESAASMKMNVKGEEIVEALEKWYNEKLTEENQKYILDILKGCISAEAITVSKVTPAELKGDYISFDTETECVTLTITEDVAKQFVEQLEEKVVDDEKIKDIIISFLNCFGDDLLKQMTEKTAEELYNELMDSFDDFEEEVFGESEEVSEASGESDEDGVIVIKRYFAGGHCVKNDIIIEDNEEKYLELICWDVYANTTAREYGIKLDIEGDNWLTVIGGANKTDAAMSATVNLYDDDVYVSADKAEKTNEKICGLKLDASRNAEGVTVSGELEAEDDDESLDLSFEYKQSESGLEIDVDAKATDFAGKVSYKKAADKIDLSSDITAEKTNITLECSYDKDGGTVKMVEKEDGEEICTLDGKLTIEENKCTLDADIVEIDGQTRNAAKILIVCTTKTEGSKTDMDIDMSIIGEGLLEIEAGINVSYDNNTSKTPEAPSKDGAYVVDGEDDMEGIEDLFTPTFKTILNNIGYGDEDQSGDYPDYSDMPDITEDVDEAMLGTWECEFDGYGYTIFYTFNEDQTGVSGYNDEAIYTLVFCSNADDHTISVIEFDEDGEPVSYFEGTYVIDGTTLTIIADGEIVEFTKVTPTASF